MCAGYCTMVKPVVSGLLFQENGSRMIFRFLVSFFFVDHLLNCFVTRGGSSVSADFLIFSCGFLA